MSRQEEEIRSNLVQILRPWAGLLSITTCGLVSVDTWTLGQRIEQTREAMILLALAVDVDPMALHALASAGWFKDHDEATPINPAARMRGTSLRVDKNQQHVPGLVGSSGAMRGPAQAIFDSAVRVLRALGRRERNDPVVISIVVVLHDSGWMTVRNYTDDLPSLLCRLVHRASDITGFQVSARVEVTLGSPLLSSELVTAITTVAQEQPTVRFTRIGIDPLLVTCSKEQLTAFLTAAAPASCDVHLRLEFRRGQPPIQYSEVDVIRTVPMICSVLLQHRTPLCAVNAGELLASCADHRAWRVVLDSIVALLLSTTVMYMDWGKLGQLDASDRELIHEWAASNASSAVLLSSQVRKVVIDANGVEFVKELLQVTERVDCEELAYTGGRTHADFEFISLAPAKFAALRVVQIQFAVVGAAELAAIATLPRLEELNFAVVTLDRDQLVLLLESLVLSGKAPTCRRQFRSLRLYECKGEDDEYLPNDAMAGLFSTILKTNKYLQHLFLSVHEKTEAWAEVEAHKGEVVYASPMSPEAQEQRCAFLSVVTHANAAVAVGRLDTFLVRKIFSWSDFHAIRHVSIELVGGWIFH